MAITATTPTMLGTVTYDRWAFTLSALSDGCVDYGGSAPPAVLLSVRAVKARVLADGVTWERSPLSYLAGSPDLVQFTLDPYAEGATNTVVAQAMQAVVAAVDQYGHAKGLL